MKSKLMVAGALVGVLGVMAVANRAEANPAGDCLSNAGDAFVDCVNSHAWYVAPLCELRYNADALRCAVI